MGRDDDLVTLEELMGSKDFDPCSKCGGHAIRRSNQEQVAYYRAAHRLYDLAQQVHSVARKGVPDGSDWRPGWRNSPAWTVPRQRRGSRHGNRPASGSRSWTVYVVRCPGPDRHRADPGRVTAAAGSPPGDTTNPHTGQQPLHASPNKGSSFGRWPSARPSPDRTGCRRASRRTQQYLFQVLPARWGRSSRSHDGEQPSIEAGIEAAFGPRQAFPHTDLARGLLAQDGQ